MIIFPYTKVVGYVDDKPVYYKEGTCDSSDTKPTAANTVGFFDIACGFLVEEDTGKVSFYNSKTDSWIEQFSFQG